MKIKKIMAIALIVITVLVVLAIGSVAAFLLKQYHNSYVSVEFVERTGTYVMPEYPEVEYETDGDTDTDLMTEEAEVSEETGPVTENADTEDITSDTAVITESVTETAEIKQPSSSSASTEVKKDTNVYGGVAIEKVEQKDKDILNILLVGQDLRFDSGKRGRSDTMIVASYNKKTGDIKMVSLLRDSLVPIEGYDWNRLNSAYAIGGIGFTINTINKLFDLDIQNFVVIDLLGMVRVIDRIGGVDIVMTEKDARYYNEHFEADLQAGLCHLNGKMVKNYVRSRKGDSDYGRSLRQRTVLTVLIDKVLKEKSLSEIMDIIDYGTSQIKTNISIMTMVSLASSIVAQKDMISVDTITVPSSGDFVYAYYNRKAIISFDIEKAKKQIGEYLYD